MDHVTLGSGTFQDISDVLAFTKFKMCIFFGNVRDSPHVPEIRPACRDSRLRAEIRVAKTPSDNEPSHIFFFLPPRNTFLFQREIYYRERLRAYVCYTGRFFVGRGRECSDGCGGTLIEILYIFYIFYFLTAPLYFGQRNTRLGYFSDISDVLAFAKFDLCIFFKKYTHLELGER